MLPGLTLPASLGGLLWSLRPVFTGPSYRTFCGLVAGLTGQARRRTVCGMLLGADLSQCWARTCPSAGRTVAVDDSVFPRCGRKVHGAAWQHDGVVPGEG